MLIYFAASTSGLPKFKENYKHIIKSLKSQGHQVVNNWIISQIVGDETQKDPNEVFKNEYNLLNQSDFVVAEIAVPSFGIGYAIKQALMLRKPILCLYPDTLDPDLASEVLLGNTSNLIRVQYYNLKNARKVINDNLNGIGHEELIKFNFLISPEIGSYLDWATEKTKQSKSEFLRDAIIKNIINEDKEYLEMKKKR